MYQICELLTASGGLLWLSKQGRSSLAEHCDPAHLLVKQGDQSAHGAVELLPNGLHVLFLHLHPVADKIGDAIPECFPIEKKSCEHQPPPQARHTERHKK